MPCSDGRDFGRGCDGTCTPTVEYRDSQEMINENKRLVAIICALISELNELGIADKVVTSAEENGEVEIKKFWSDHYAEDMSRLQNKIKDLSTHERRMLKKILDN